MAYKNIEDRKVASKRYYEANKLRYFERNKRYRKKIVNYVNQIKEENPCTDCKKYFPSYVMDFDNLEGEQKLGLISMFTATGRIKALKEEIMKCELVCANCHRMRTHKRLKEPVE